MGSCKAFAWALCIAAACSGCLSVDEGVPPATFTLSASSSEASLHGIETLDGWTLDIDRALFAIGRPLLIGSDCEQRQSDVFYSPYARILSVTTPGPQKVATLFAHGNCDLMYEHGVFAELDSGGRRDIGDIVLGAGVSELDRERLLRGANNPTLYLEGRAASATQSVRFALRTERSISHGPCWPQALPSLASGQDVELTVAMKPARLFSSTLSEDAGGGLRFQPFADADALQGDADGLIEVLDLQSVVLGNLLDGTPFTLWDQLEPNSFGTAASLTDGTSCSFFVMTGAD